VFFSSNRSIQLNENHTVLINYNDLQENLQQKIVKVERITGDEHNEAIKFLGVLIDPSLSFKPHIASIRKKITSALYFMRSCKNILTSKALMAMYYALIHSRLIYAIQFWSSCSPQLISILFKLQKQAIRIICNLPYNGHTESFFKSTNIIPLPSLIEYFKIQT